MVVVYPAPELLGLMLAEPAPLALTVPEDLIPDSITAG